MNNPNFDTWYAANKASMQSLHWHAYSFLERIFNHLAKFATDFGNVNIMSGSRPLTELNTNPLTKALTVLKAFEVQLTLAQSTNSPITILATTVSKFSTRTPGTNPILITPASIPSVLLLYRRTPRINAVMSSATILPHTRVLKRPPYSAKRNPAAMVLLTLLSNTQSLIWACYSSPETTSRP